MEIGSIYSIAYISISFITTIIVCKMMKTSAIMFPAMFLTMLFLGGAFVFWIFYPLYLIGKLLGFKGVNSE